MRRTTIEAAVRAFYAALKRREAQTIRNPRASSVLTVRIDVTGFSRSDLMNLRGKITEACSPRDRHYPARTPRFTITKGT